LALLSDGTVVAWGANEDGQLGDGSTEASDVPVPVSGLTDVLAISARTDNSLALLADGTVVAWGANEDGQLGDGSTEASDVPAPVSGLSKVSAISAGSTHGMALQENGDVWAWGGNDYGELGDETKEPSDVPVRVTSLPAASAISAGDEFSLALLDSGGVASWGRNTRGQLGDDRFGEGADTDKPVEVKELFEPVIAVSAGTTHSLALLQSGWIAAWGGDEYGELGNGSQGGDDFAIVPIVLSGLCGVHSVAAADLFSLAVADLEAACPVIEGLSPKAGAEAGGTTVEISGSGFGEATRVQFGEAEAASFTVNSQASITAVSPPGYGVVNVRVTVPGGMTAATSASAFRYNTPPRPAITSISPKTGPAAGGTKVTIKGQNFEEVSGVAFGGARASEVQTLSNHELQVVSPQHAVGKVHVLVTTSGGSSAAVKASEFKYKKK
jgi:hypothetical protein